VEHPKSISDPETDTVRSKPGSSWLEEEKIFRVGLIKKVAPLPLMLLQVIVARAKVANCNKFSFPAA
jgi:hypothetical protein